MRGSPFAVEVTPSTCAAQRCEAFGDALRTAPLKAPASFIILARDSFGNRLRVGGDQFLVSFRGPCNPDVKVVDRDDGTYRVTYVPNISGRAEMSVVTNRCHIRGSPFVLDVQIPGHPSHAPPGSLRPPSPRGKKSPPTHERQQQRVSWNR